MKANVGKIDRVVRIVVGLLLVSNVFVGLQNPLGWIGVVMILTGLIGSCPLYSLLKINTRSAAEKLGLK